MVVGIRYSTYRTVGRYGTCVPIFLRLVFFIFLFGCAKQNKKKRPERTMQLNFVVHTTGLFANNKIPSSVARCRISRRTSWRCSSATRARAPRSGPPSSQRTCRPGSPSAASSSTAHMGRGSSSLGEHTLLLIN